jgi:uncharacterized membrane protein YtjA (UPF0391 family)
VLQHAFQSYKASTVWSSLPCWVRREKNRGGVPESGTEAISPFPDPGKILNRKHKEDVMLRWALGFFVVALLAALLGFSGIAVASAGIAKILFFIFLVLFLVSLVSHLIRRT